MILIIAAREFKNLFISPLAWTVLGIVQTILGWLLLNQMDTYLDLQPQLAQLANPPGVTEMIVAPLFGASAMVLLVISPILGMASIAEERRSRTLTLLYTAPVSLRAIVAGKFLGLLGFQSLIVILTTITALSLHVGVKLDFGLLAANVIGLGLLAACCCALSLYFSCLTAQPAIAAVGGIGAALGLWLLDIASRGTSFLTTLSLLQHFSHTNQGLLDSADIAYFLVFCTAFLALCVLRLDRDRMP